jgi:hypothetical protein
LGFIAAFWLFWCFFVGLVSCSCGHRFMSTSKIGQKGG